MAERGVAHAGVGYCTLAAGLSPPQPRHRPCFTSPLFLHTPPPLRSIAAAPRRWQRKTSSTATPAAACRRRRWVGRRGPPVQGLAVAMHAAAQAGPCLQGAAALLLCRCSSPRPPVRPLAAEAHAAGGAAARAVPAPQALQVHRNPGQVGGWARVGTDGCVCVCGGGAGTWVGCGFRSPARPPPGPSLRCPTLALRTCAPPTHALCAG